MNWKKVAETSRTIGIALLSNVPLALIAVPASYGAAVFSEKVYPSPWNWILGAAFESSYLGAMIFARNKSRNIFITTVAVAAACGIVYNMLHAAQIDSLLVNWDTLGRWLLAFIHGAPLSFLGVMYAMMMHFTADHIATVTKSVKETEEYKNLEIDFTAQIEEAKRQVAEALEKLQSKETRILQLEAKEELNKGQEQRLDNYAKQLEAFYNEKLNAEQERLADSIKGQYEQQVIELQENLFKQGIELEQERLRKNDALSNLDREKRLMAEQVQILNREIEMLRDSLKKQSETIAKQTLVSVANKFSADGGKPTADQLRDTFNRSSDKDEMINTLFLAWAEAGVEWNTLKAWVMRHKNVKLVWTDVAEDLRKRKAHIEVTNER